MYIIPAQRGFDNYASHLPWSKILETLLSTRFFRVSFWLKQSKTLSYRPRMKTDLLDAIDAALAGDWHRAHKIVPFAPERPELGRG